MKIVINVCYGSFALSKLACKRLKCDKYDYTHDYSARTDPKLIALIEELGAEKVGSHSGGTHLKIVEIPDDVKWTIEEYNDDGREIVSEVHRTWC